MAWLSNCIARKWIDFVKNNNIQALEDCLRNESVSHVFPPMKEHSHLQEHSLLYCAIYYNKYEIVDFLLTNHPSCYKSDEASICLETCFEMHCRISYGASAYDIFTLLLLKCSISLSTVLNAILRSTGQIKQMVQESFITFTFQLYETELCTTNIHMYLLNDLMNRCIDTRSEQFIMLLLEYGVDPNLIMYETSYLHWIMLLHIFHPHFQDVKIVNILIQYGAFINIENLASGRLPIDYLNKTDDETECIRCCLIQHGSLLPTHGINI